METTHRFRNRRAHGRPMLPATATVALPTEVSPKVSPSPNVANSSPASPFADGGVANRVDCDLNGTRNMLMILAAKLAGHPRPCWLTPVEIVMLCSGR